MKNVVLLLLASFCTVGIALAQTTEEVRRATPVLASVTDENQTDTDAASQFIAGIQPSSPGAFADLAATAEWRAFADKLDDCWQPFEKYRLQPIREWLPRALPGFRPATVFYPFSGPDYIYARTLFPDATTYILAGLEPAGTSPSLQTVQSLSSTLGWTQVSVKTFLEAGYFVTKEMRVQLKQSPLQGTVPVICLMMARSGDRILSIKTDATHAEIRFRALGEMRTRTLHYFSVNLSNDALRSNQAFLRFVGQSRPDVGYLKSASYLLHEAEFSTIRDTLLTQCPAILQDDSGVPFRAFDPARWQFMNFGVYTPPLDIFKKYNQNDLADFYARFPSTPLSFGVGYHWDPKTANLILARRSR